MTNKKLLFLSVAFGCCLHSVSAVNVEVSWKDYFVDTFYILREFFKSPDVTSAITASSPAVVKDIAKRVDVGNILEIGAGPGTLSDPIAKSLEKGEKEYRLDIVECNSSFYKRLKSRVEELPNVHLYNEYFSNEWYPNDIDNIENFYDTVISTIPLTRLPKEHVENILKKILTILKPGGVFIYISLMGARPYGKVLSYLSSRLKRNSTIYEKYLEKMKFLDCWDNNHFEKNQKRELKNITPIWIYFAVKKTSN